jgi:uncharacterized membrane protein
VTQSAPEAGSGALSNHVEESVEAIAELHRKHYEHASGLQRAIDRVTQSLGRPAVTAVVLTAFAAWLAAAWMASDGRIESSAFRWLELAGTLAALVIALLILVTQREQDALAERRDQLTLELAILSDRKAAKIISLIEELRRDAPDVADRHDPESTEMAKPTDPGQILTAIDRRTPDSPES